MVKKKTNIQKHYLMYTIPLRQAEQVLQSQEPQDSGAAGQHGEERVQDPPQEQEHGPGA